jgi:hypothetical protein
MPPPELFDCRECEGSGVDLRFEEHLEECAGCEWCYSEDEDLEPACGCCGGTGDHLGGVCREDNLGALPPPLKPPFPWMER